MREPTLKYISHAVPQKMYELSVIAKSTKCFFFQYKQTLSEWKRLTTLNFSGTKQGEPNTRPPIRTTPRQPTIITNFMGPYNRGYLAALFVPSRPLRNKTTVIQKNLKLPKIPILIVVFFVSLLSCFGATERERIHNSRDIQQPRYKNICIDFYIAAIVFRGCRETLFRAYIAAAARRRSR